MHSNSEERQSRGNRSELRQGARRGRSACNPFIPIMIWFMDAMAQIKTQIAYNFVKTLSEGIIENQQTEEDIANYGEDLKKERKRIPNIVCFGLSERGQYYAWQRRILHTQSFYMSCTLQGTRGRIARLMIQTKYDSEVEKVHKKLSEEEMIKSEAFEKECNAAIDNVCFVAQRDRQTMLNNVRWQFEQETGEEATNEMMTDAIKTFGICDDEEDALCDIDSDEFRKEFEQALFVVRDVAKVDQARLVNTICDISSDLCDREPDVTQMSQIFDRIKESLADEAREEFLDLYETCVDHEDSDSDYDVRFDLNDCEESERC
eukprot:257087_1